jgi:hypothetical protein
VDEPAEKIPPANVGRVDGDRVPRFGQRWGEAKPGSTEADHLTA